MHMARYIIRNTRIKTECIDKVRAHLHFAWLAIFYLSLSLSLLLSYLPLATYARMYGILSTPFFLLPSAGKGDAHAARRRWTGGRGHVLDRPGPVSFDKRLCKHRAFAFSSFVKRNHIVQSAIFIASVGKIRIVFNRFSL